MKNNLTAINDTELLTPAELAKRLGVSPITLRKWANMGLLQSQATLGGHRRYPLSEVERLLQRHNRQQSPQIQIMIVDDDLFVSAILREFLTGLSPSITVGIANDGFAAGRQVSTFRPDIILLDLMMPGMNGFEVCHQIKSAPSTARIRVIAMTGYPTEENIKRVQAAGAEACLAKPVDNSELLAVLNLPQSLVLNLH